MKLFCLSDLHVRDTPPRSRVGNYYQQQFDKLEWCFELAKKQNCQYVLLPGDLYHTNRLSYKAISDLNDLLLHYNYEGIKSLAVAGNHDQRFHSSDIANTPLNVLRSSGAITILNNEPYSRDNIHFYGASWNELIPEIQDETVINILLIHKMVIKGEKIWDGQENCVQSNLLLRKHKFDLIVSGDNHSSFTDFFMNKYLINAGSLMRMTSAQIDHQPTCGIYDTSTKNLETHNIPMLSTTEVFDLDKISKEKKWKQDNVNASEYVKELMDDSESFNFDFVSNLKGYMDKNNIQQGTRDIINECLEGV